jgi:DNA repair protein RadC
MIPEIKISVTISGKADLFKVTGSKTCFEFFYEIMKADNIDWTESFVMICLNKANNIIGFYKVSQGGISGTVVDPKVIFTVALNCMASSIILCHNHPSGNTQPSVQDKAITKKIVESGKFLDITVLDHIIIGDSNKYYSFADEYEL